MNIQRMTCPATTSRGWPCRSYMASRKNGSMTIIMQNAAALLLAVRLSKKKSGTPMSAAAPSHDHPLSGWHVLPLEGDITCLRPEGALKSANCTTFTAAPKLGAFSVLPYSGVASKEACWFALTSYFRSKRDLLIVFLHRLTRERVDILY